MFPGYMAQLSYYYCTKNEEVLNGKLHFLCSVFSPRLVSWTSSRLLTQCCGIEQGTSISVSENDFEAGSYRRFHIPLPR